MTSRNLPVHGLVLVATLTCAACLPAETELAPKGAAAFITEPSAASRGEPFVTDDGWNVHIDRLALVARVRGSNRLPAENDDDDIYMWNGAARVELLVRALPVGPSSLTAEVQTPGRSFTNGLEVPSYVNLGLEPQLEARLRAPFAADPLGDGAAIVMIARAEKDGFSVVLDVALRPSSPPDANQAASNIDVPADDVVFAHLDVVAERIFRADPPIELATAFQPIADADARGDGDGHVTVAELRGVRAACDTCPDAPDGAEHTLVDRFSFLVGQVLVPR